MRRVYAIRNTAGEQIAEHVRVDWPGGKKRMYWQIPSCDPQDGLMGLSSSDLPLYGSERIPGFEVGQTVVACEGEKATEALWSLGIDALGIVTGASATPGEDALSVLLAFDVVLWPDNDREGWQLMNRVAWAVKRLGGNLPRVIAPDDPAGDGARVHTLLEKGFDAADFVSRRGGRVQASMLIHEAEAWALHLPPRPVRLVRPAYDRSQDDDRIESARSNLLAVVEQKLGAPKEWKQGTPWWCCPFHGDRSPSFKVDMREPFFRCFGCEARGDVFEFLKRIDGLAFKDALRELAPPLVTAASIRTVTVWDVGTGNAIGQ